jgi:hypothetical protein
MDIADLVTALTDIGVVAVVTIGATLYLAGRLYKRFRS